MDIPDDMRATAHHTVDEDGDDTFEWWKGERSLSVFEIKSEGARVAMLFDKLPNGEQWSKEYDPLDESKLPELYAWLMGAP